MRAMEDPAMLLSALMRAAGLPDPETDLDVTGLAADSRAVRPGDLFAALPGERVRAPVRAALANTADSARR